MLHFLFSSVMIIKINAIVVVKGSLEIRRCVTLIYGKLFLCQREAGVIRGLPYLIFLGRFSLIYRGFNFR